MHAASIARAVRALRLSFPDRAQEVVEALASSVGPGLALLEAATWDTVNASAGGTRIQRSSALRPSFERHVPSALSGGAAEGIAEAPIERRPELVAEAISRRRAALIDRAIELDPRAVDRGRVAIYDAEATTFDGAAAASVEPAFAGMLDGADAPGWDGWFAWIGSAQSSIVVTWLPERLFASFERAIPVTPTGSLSWAEPPAPWFHPPPWLAELSRSIKR